MKKLNAIIVVIITLLVYANNGYAATLSGKVIDAETAESLEGIEVGYDANDFWQSNLTDPNGTFNLINLPAGTAGIEANPTVDSGYVPYLPWGSSFIYLNGVESRSDRIIALQKGAFASGYIKDSNGDPLGNIEFGYEGKSCERWLRTDSNGYYEIRIPLGTYTIGTDWIDEGITSINQIVTVTDITQPVDVNDIIAYSTETGGQISGTVNNPSGYSKTGQFYVAVFKAGEVIDPNRFFLIIEIGASGGLEAAGAFDINALPTGINYDIYLFIAGATPGGQESIAVQDFVSNISIGTTDVNLYYNSEGSTVTGRIENPYSHAVLGAEVLLNDSNTERFAGVGEVAPNGEYIIYNVPAGTYTATALHSKYQNASTTVEVLDGVTANVNTIVMPFVGEKEGADLNGDGMVNMVDFAKFANQWGQSGSLDANFDQQGTVDSADLLKVAENWLWKAMWYHE